jgi:hypothetical protein
MAKADDRSRSRSRANGARPSLDLLEFLLTRRAASVPCSSPTLVHRQCRGRGPSDLVDPSVTARIEQLEAVGRELTRRGPLDVLRRVRARSDERLALLFGSGGSDDET